LWNAGHCSEFSLRGERACRPELKSWQRTKSHSGYRHASRQHRDASGWNSDSAGGNSDASGWNRYAWNFDTATWRNDSTAHGRGTRNNSAKSGYTWHNHARRDYTKHKSQQYDASWHNYAGINIAKFYDAKHSSSGNSTGCSTSYSRHDITSMNWQNAAD
jgi:hypothetical protein